jgi:hypothetical protein
LQDLFISMGDIHKCQDPFNVMIRTPVDHIAFDGYTTVSRGNHPTGSI